MTEKRLSLIDKLVFAILALMVLFVVMIPFLSVLEQEETKDNASQVEEILDHPLDEEDLKDDVWQVEEIFDDLVTVSVNGKISHGDRFRLWFRHENEEQCNIAQSSTIFTSVGDHIKKNFSNLPSEVILAEINESEKFLAEIISVSDFFMGEGKRTFLNLGVMPADRIIDYHKDNDEIKIELLAFYDRDEQKSLPENIEEYFDIPINIWSLNGFEEAIKAGKAECLTRIGE